MLGIILLLSLINFGSAAHFIVGIAEDAKDGTSANGKTVVMWNPSNGLNDNITDIVGKSGNSGVDNIYMMDCELLNEGCSVGNILSLKIFDEGDNHITEIENILITGVGYDLVNNLTLNTPPYVNLIYPLNYQNISYSEININCSFGDLDNNLANITLYGNWSGGWQVNETLNINSGETYKIFSKILEDGIYEYNCQIKDNLSVSNFSEHNNTFVIDTTSPLIASVSSNLSSGCGSYFKTARITCEASDIHLENVLIQAQNLFFEKNYSTQFLGGNDYYSDISLNESGNWTFTCFANDSFSNNANLESEIYEVFSDSPEFYIEQGKVNVSNENPIETEKIAVYVKIKNLGCSSGIINVGFFEGDPSFDGTNIGNKTIFVDFLSSNNTFMEWEAKINLTNIFILADYGDEYSELNESDNKANKTIWVGAWQQIYGNVSVDKFLGYGQSVNISFWKNQSDLEGNIFITDKEANVAWSSLRAIGKTKSGEDSSNDFFEIDEGFEMKGFNDSVAVIFSDNQIPKNTEDFFVHQSTIPNVPIINSSKNSVFITGILWDSSDSTDNEYDSGEKEDVVFIGKISKQTKGAFGNYDYEIKIPSKLRDYNSADDSEIYFYYDLN